MKITKIGLFSLFLLLMSLRVNCQTAVSGHVIEKRVNEPLAYANIAMLSAEDSSYVSGTVSDEHGFFAITNLNTGKCPLLKNVYSFL